MLINLDTLNDKNLIVIQIKSEIGSAEDQRRTLKGLGLNGIGTKIEIKCNKSFYGMLSKVRHLIDIKIK